MMELRWSLFTGLIYYLCLVLWSNKLISDVILVYQFLALVVIDWFLVCRYIFWCFELICSKKNWTM